MRDPQLIGLIFLLAVAVVAAYFYLKRAQRRAPEAATDETAPAEPRPAGSWDASTGTAPSAPPSTSSSAAGEGSHTSGERGG
jgi:hypothetical protein